MLQISTIFGSRIVANILKSDNVARLILCSLIDVETTDWYKASYLIQNFKTHYSC